MNVLYIGGTGEISYACLQASVEAGQRCAVFNRGRSAEPLPAGVRQITGDLNDPGAYEQLGREHFDVVCQFKAYTLADIQRDVRVFGGRTGQYLFISTASAYQKPPQRYCITEAVPLHNPFWAYSQSKADMELRLLQEHADGRLPITIVRPSHTLRTKFPGSLVSGDDHAWRMVNGKAVIVHGDGSSLWTITAASDFARPFARLLGNPRSLGQAFHITSDEAHRWDQIFAMVGQALGVAPTFVHVPTQTLIRYSADFAGPLLGDKAWPTLFDNSKVKAVAGDFQCEVPLQEALRQSARRWADRRQHFVPSSTLHALLDRIAAEQGQLGA